MYPLRPTSLYLNHDQKRFLSRVINKIALKGEDLHFLTGKYLLDTAFVQKYSIFLNPVFSFVSSQMQ